MDWSTDSGSDTESERAAPPLKFSFADPKPFQHLTRGLVTDAISKGRVTGNTKLAVVYSLDDGNINNQLLASLTKIASPAVLCRIKHSDGQLYPPTLNSSYYLKLTYNKLLLAPTVRLECHFVKQAGEKIAPYLTLSVEFHFNDIGNGSGIQEYKLLEDGTLTFKATGATCSGFNKVPRFESVLTETDHQVILLLRSYLSDEMKTLEFKLHEELLTSIDMPLLSEIRARLPGGSKPQLPSIGVAEYKAFHDDIDYIFAKHDSMHKPGTLLRGRAPFPFLRVDCPDTFATLKEACVQLAYSAFTMEAEDRTSLRLWAKTHHNGKLYPYGSFVVIGVDFNAFPKIGSEKHQVQYKLPREMHTKMEFYFKGRQHVFYGFSMSNASGLGKHDAHFLITSRSLKFFVRDLKAPVSDVTRELAGELFIKFTPHYKNFTFASQMETIARLQCAESMRWRDILLNQTHSAIEDVDLTAGLDGDAVQAADNWLKTWMQWNAEQLQVIEGIKRTKGGMVLVMGPAGTGKTLLEQALALYFYKLGYHVLALAPANSNANHLANELNKIDSIVPDFAFSRLYPGSRDLKLDKMSEVQAEARTVGHEKGRALSLSEVQIALDELDRTGTFSHEYGVVEQVIQNAVKGSLKLSVELQDEHGNSLRVRTDAWEVMRDFIKACRENSFDRSDSTKLQRWRSAYTICKAHVIRRSRFMITTTGNVRARELLDFWYKPSIDKGVIVFVDEAAKDLEVNVWAGIVCEAWGEAVKGVFMFGDDKQLSPTNTSSKRGAIFNAFLDRLDVALPCRLIREGFPHFRLKEQRRMNQYIAAFVNQEIYDNELRNGPEAQAQLADVKPGLQDALNDILATSGRFTSQQDRELCRKKGKPRLHYVQVEGRREPKGQGSSLLVEEHVDVFFKDILPKLQAYFMARKEKMEDYVMVICAYSAALHEYENRISDLLKLNAALTRADFPRVLTVDASQGQEALMVVFDGSFQHGDVIGFMADRGRANVAITRAKEVFWMIGGSMEKRFWRSAYLEDNLLTKYKKNLDKRGRVLQFR